jgi:hypothetical protein
VRDASLMLLPSGELADDEVRVSSCPNDEVRVLGHRTHAHTTPRCALLPVASLWCFFSAPFCRSGSCKTFSNLAMLALFHFFFLFFVFFSVL